MSLIIEKIDCDIKKVPLKHPFITALHEVDEIESVRVKVTLSDGTCSIGTATPNEKVTGDSLQTAQDVIKNVITPVLVGKDFDNWNECLSLLKNSIVHNTPAKAAVEIALYNARAKESKQSLVNLLGSSAGSTKTDYTISIGSQDHMVNEAKDLVGQGFSALKIKLGANSLLEDIDTVKKIGQAVGDKISLRIDCNQAWNCKQTLQASRAWQSAGTNVAFIEQPVKKDAIEDMVYLTAHSLIPIMADESVASYEDAINLLENRACDYINIKLMKTGGLSEAIKINDLAQAHNVNTMVGCMIEPVESIAAAVAFAVANKNVQFIDLDSIFMATGDPDLEKYLSLKGNVITLKG
ncbi:dipeptide epimerase [uncultured Lactobacillus sp.]|uniref:dipeptide epimerase n=1 Tax=uncultured Lactobacillus sp. TaxID=153152 RepID=UPI00261628D6|nr:dipeptide epimerase [uncultured Lactobacillus sp.]